MKSSEIELFGMAKNFSYFLVWHCQVKNLFKFCIMFSLIKNESSQLKHIYKTLGFTCSGIMRQFSVWRARFRFIGLKCMWCPKSLWHLKGTVFYNRRYEKKNFFILDEISKLISRSKPTSSTKEKRAKL